MGPKEFTKSGAFAVTVFALVLALLPFGLEQVGETTGLFKFSAKGTVVGWFAGSAPAGQRAAVKPVDWERYRQDLGAFSQWADSQRSAVISLPREPVEIRVIEREEAPERRVWAVPVASCTAGDPVGRKRGYVFISGFDRIFEEGAFIAPANDLCGYEIVSVGERTVWFRAVVESEGDVPMGVVKLPEFTRAEGEDLVRGNRKYVARDAFPLTSGGWLMVDSFLPPDGAVFKVLDENRRVVTTLLCVVIGEKGGK